MQGISFRIHNDEKARINKDGALQFNNTLGNKIMFWTGTGTDNYGFGLNGANLNAFINGDGSFSLRKGGYDGAELLKVDGGGNMTLSGNFTPSYVSGWQQSAASSSDILTFDVGFFPVLVSVIAQVRGPNGYVDLYTHISPARHSWDDLDTRGETVYTITGTKVQVHPRGTSVGTNIWNGNSPTRFRVYAWRVV